MIVVTAPAGQIGRQVVQDLLAVGAPLRVIVRDPAKLPADVRDRAEVVEGSHGDEAVVGRAFAGADALFWLVPPDGTKTMEASYLDFARAAAQAIDRHGVKRVVSVTALGRGTAWEDKAGLVTASIHMDSLLMSTGAAFRGLAMPSFMENTARQAATIKDKGVFFGPIAPDKTLPLTATRDMAAVAAGLLLDGSWTGQAEVPVIGPEDLSANDMAAVMSDVLGRDVRYQPISFDAFRTQFLDRGFTESFAQGYVDMYRAKDEGMDNISERGTAARAPTTFRQWCEGRLQREVLG